MTNKNTSKDQIVSVLREWAAPLLLSIVGMLLWRDISEMRADVKLLLTTQSANQVKIDQLEKDVDLLKTTVFSGNIPEPKPISITKNTQPYVKPDEVHGPVPVSEDNEL